MPLYRAPRSDFQRVVFMRRALVTAQQGLDGGNARVDQDTVVALADLLSRFEAAREQLPLCIAERAQAVRLKREALRELECYVRDFAEGLRRRVRRERLSTALFAFYHLPQDGTLSPLSAMDEWLQRADALIQGDSAAVLEGYAPLCNPSAEEVQARLLSARDAAATRDEADRALDQAQATLAALRPQADDLIKEVVAQIRFATRRLDAPSQRRVLRRYGARFVARGGGEEEEGEGDNGE